MGHPVWVGLDVDPRFGWRRCGTPLRPNHFTYENVPHKAVEFEIASRVKIGGCSPEKKASCRERPDTYVAIH